MHLTSRYRSSKTEWLKSMKTRHNGDLFHNIFKLRKSNRWSVRCFRLLDVRSQFKYLMSDVSKKTKI